jgi:hypothetical protein
VNISEENDTHAVEAIVSTGEQLASILSGRYPAGHLITLLKYPSTQYIDPYPDGDDQDILSFDAPQGKSINSSSRNRRTDYLEDSDPTPATESLARIPF